jgi:hypothetical protein
MAPGSLSFLLTSVMLMSCGTLVVVQAVSSNAVAWAPGHISGLDLPVFIDPQLDCGF